MNINIRVTQMMDIYKCPRKFWLNNIYSNYFDDPFLSELKIPEKRTYAFYIMGQIIHKCVESRVKFNHMKLYPSIDTIIKNELWQPGEHEKINKEQEKIENIMCLIEEKIKLNFIFSEQTLNYDFEYKMKNGQILQINLSGTPDYFLQNGILLDVKTLAKKEKDETLINRYRHQLQMYAFLLNQNYIFPQKLQILWITKTKEPKCGYIDIPYNPDCLQCIPIKLWKMANHFELLYNQYGLQPWPETPNDGCRICEYAHDCHSEGGSILDIEENYNTNLDIIINKIEKGE